MDPPSESGRALILIVERDPHIRELEKIYLEEAGFAIEFADDGITALERARELRPHLLITEVLLPGLDGIGLCERLKEHPDLQDTCVLVLSEVHATLRARKAGADAFMAKPIGRQRLVDVVRALLDRSGTLRIQEEA